MKFKKVFLVVNNYAGKRITNVILPFLELGLSNRNISYDKVYFESVKELPNKISSLSSKGVLFVTLGGDGTLNLVLNGIMKSNYIRSFVLPLPFGSSNLFCKKVGLKSYKDFFDIIDDPKLRKIDVLKVNYGKDLSNEKYFLSWLSSGFDEKVVENISNSVKLFMGKLGFILYGIIRFIKHSFNEYTLSTDKDNLKGSYFIIGQLNYYATRLFRPLYNSSLDDGKFDVFLIKTKRKHRILYSLFLVFLTSFFTKRMKSRFFEHYKLSKITVSSNFKSEFQIDGDICGNLPIKVSVSKYKLNLLLKNN